MKRIWLITLLLALLAACARDDSGDDVKLSSVSTDTGQYTCVSLSGDSAELALGGTEPYFSVYNLASQAVEIYPLPPETGGYKTYDVMRVSPESWLVAKQNNGVLYVSYGLDEKGRRSQSHVCRIASPRMPLPDKGTHYSVYSLIDVDSMVILGSSNGLKYLTSADMAQLETDTLVTARYASPLEHERVARYQFAQEAMFVKGDSLITATDDGLYRVALADFGKEGSHATVVAHPMRCHDAAMGGDSLYVLWSKDETTDRRHVTAFSLADWGSSTRDADPSTTWLGFYGDTLRCFGREGNFGCFRAAATVGDNFYFLRDGYLRKSNIDTPIDETDERISFSDNGYGLSNKMGLWRLDDGRPEFLGELKGVAGVRGVSVSDGMMYLAVADGVYSVSLASRGLARDRRAELVEPVLHRAGDRVESVCASGDTLLVGMRNGLHMLMLGSGDRRDYVFGSLRDNYESPYVRRISREGDGSWLLSTLNHGNWSLREADASGPVATDREFENKKNDYGPLTRPSVTWKALGDNLFAAVVAVMALLGLVGGLLMVVRHRHNLAIKSLKNNISERIKTQKDLESQRAQLESAATMLRNELELAKVKLDRKLSLPLREVYEAVERYFPAEVPDCPLKNELRRLVEPIERYIRHAGEWDAGSMPRVYMGLCRYVEEVIASVLAIKSQGAHDSIFSDCISEYIEQLEGMGDPGLLSVAGQIGWLRQASRCLDTLKEEAAKVLATQVAAIAPDEECFTDAQLQRLWATCLVGLATVPSRLAIAKGSDLSGLDWQPRQRTWVVTTYTLFGIAKPQVEGETLRIDIPAIVGLRDARHHGSVYYFWMRQLSTYTFINKGASFPANGADLLWQIRLSRDPAMRDGIMMAHYYDSDRELPATLSALIEGRPRGRRPKNMLNGN